MAAKSQKVKQDLPQTLTQRRLSSNRRRFAIGPAPPVKQAPRSSRRVNGAMPGYKAR